MAGSFDALGVALSGLYAQRRGLDVTGQNVANANTDGYSRQRVVLEAVGAPATPAMHAVWDGAGGGVRTGELQRLRDTFLEARAQTEHGRAAQLETRQGVLAQVEQLLGEPGGTGLASTLSDFWSGWSDVANRPGDLAARSQLLQRGGTLAAGLRQAYQGLAAQWTAQREQLGAVVAEVNTAATNIAELNQAILRARQAGLPAGELQDRRDLLVMGLADKVGAAARPGADGVVDVYLGGSALVRGATAEQLSLTGAADLSAAGTDPVTIRWARDATPALVAAGTAGGALDALNGTLPAYAGRLDAVAADLAAKVNAQHAAGYDLSGVPGGAFFTGSTAATLAVALTDPGRVAAAATAGGTLDGGNAAKLAALATDPASPDRGYRQLVVDLGVDAQTTNRRVDIQRGVAAQVDAAREAQSGVSLDEEMTRMLAYQRAYEGASRVLTSVDQTLDTLINRTGLVGR
ncbi:MAG: flagellar hook-associated protein FlgK [Actinomycetota bacterium]